MDEISNVATPEEKKKKVTRNGGFFKALKSAFHSSIAKRKGEREAPIIDIFTFAIAFLLSGTHIVFGAYPLGIAFIAVLPSRVWLAAIGACAGALTLGKAGIIYSMISVIVVFLRIIVSGTENPQKEQGDNISASPLFSEGLLLKMSAALIGGFIAAVYEILLSGFSLSAVAFGLSMIILPPITAFLFSGLFDGGFTVKELIFSTLPLFDLQGRKEKERFGVIFFQCSSLVLVFLIGLSLEKYSLLGISPSYIFAGAITLFAARRFGSLRGGAVGFAAALGVSSSLSVSFALGGIAAGALCNIGILYALLGAGGTICLWSAYAGGVGGLLSVLPEYCIGAALISPAMKKVKAEIPKPTIEKNEKAASEMVGTMALSYRNKYSGCLDALETSLSSISSCIRKYCEGSRKPTKEELCELISHCKENYCLGCNEYCDCESSKDCLSQNSGEELSAALYSEGGISPKMLENRIPGCENITGMTEAINRACAILAQEKYQTAKKDSTSEDFALISKLLNEARYRDQREKATDEELSQRLAEALKDAGIEDGIIRAYGERRKHFILAAEDADGTRITSDTLRRGIERISGARLGTPDYFRRADMALMECSVCENFSADCAEASVKGEREVISGDSSIFFETADKHFFSIISDGMGSGEEARSTSEFVTQFLRRTMELGAGRQTSLCILNNIIRRRSQECSATVDLFGIDLINGEAHFLKSGAAASYIKRGSSIFRIRSRTAPIGLLSEVDAEQIKVEIEADDYVIMLSDGISNGTDDAAWLPELLSRPPRHNLKEYAEAILSEALRHTGAKDDMTVVVTKIKKIG